MTTRRIHRITLYLMDLDRKRILLHRSEEPAFKDQYMPLSAPFSDWETPMETAKQLVHNTVAVPFEFLGHNPSLPLVLDETSIKIFPPLHVQVTRVNESNDYVDFVYLGQAREEKDLKDDNFFGWFNQSNLKTAPTHVKHVVHYILALMN